MATSPAEDVSSEDEIFFGKITMKEIRARFLPKEKRRALRHANRKDVEMKGSDTSVKIIETHSEPEMNIQNDCTESSYGTTSSNKADYDIKTDGENSYLRLLPDDTFQNQTSEIKFCFDPPSIKQPMIANENLKQVAKTEQSHSFCNNNRDGLFQLEQGCKPIIHVQDDTPPHKHNPPTEENANQVNQVPDVPRQHESAKIERTPIKNSIKIIEMHSEPEMNIQNDWTESSYGTTSSNKADYDIKTNGENSYLRLLPDDSFLRLEKQVADCSFSDDTFQNHTSEIKFCFDPPSIKQPMIANENLKQVAKTEQSHSFCNNNRDGLFQLEQGCKPIIQVQDDTPPHKHNPPTEENANQVNQVPDVPRQHESAKIERTPIKNSIKIIEMHSEPEMNIQNDWTESSYGTTSSNKADYDIMTNGENSYLRLLPDDSFLRLEKQVADCSFSDDTFQNHTSGIKFCFDPPSIKQPMIANENLKQVAKTEQSHSFCNNNRDGLFQLEQGCKPIIQVQDDTPPHKHNPPTEENANQVNQVPDVPRQHESAKIERTPIKNNNFLQQVISTPRENANTDIFKTPMNTLSKKQQASSVTKAPRKVNTYQHVASPVGLYIKHSPQAPLLRTVNPKPLPISHIPKLIKKPVKEISYKVNKPLPRTVYRPPKETVVLTRDRKKISKDQLSKISASTTVVIREHAPNEVKKKEIVFQDDTYNESLISQPDFSIHIEKSTFY